MSNKQETLPVATWETAAGDMRLIPSLDGLRAVSICLVLLAHASWFLPVWLTRTSPFRYIVGSGTNGVAAFFVVSGFLITSLLLNEQQKTGSISLKRFYFRRTLRIFPPYYAFMLVMLGLWATHFVNLDPAAVKAALTYTWALIPLQQESGLIAHCWSLSIEELFYLLWPLTCCFFLGSISELR